MGGQEAPQSSPSFPLPAPTPCKINHYPDVEPHGFTLLFWNFTFMQSHSVMVMDVWVGFSLVLCLMFWHMSYEEHTCACLWVIYLGVEFLSYKECPQLALVDAAKP